MPPTSNLCQLAKSFLEDGDKRLGWSPNTITAYRSHVKSFLEWIYAQNGRDPLPEDLTLETAQKYDTARKREGRTDATRSVSMAALKTFLRFLAGRQIVTEDLSANFSQMRVRVSDQPKRKWTNREQVEELFNAAALLPKKIGKRDSVKSQQALAILTVLCHGGLRLSEAVSLTVSDIALGNNPQITVRNGKGNRTRFVPLSEASAEHLRQWLGVRRCEGSEQLFAYDDTTARGTHLVTFTGNKLKYVLYGLFDNLGWSRDCLTAHSFRRYAATTLLNVTGASLAHVKLLLGHSDILTTSKYISCETEDLRRLMSEVAPVVKPAPQVQVRTAPTMERQAVPVRMVRRAPTAWQGR